VTVDAASLLLATVAANAWSTHPLRDGVAVLAALGCIISYAATGCYRPRGVLPTRSEAWTLLTIPAVVAMSAAFLELATGHTGAGDAAVRFWLLGATLVGTGRIGIAGAEALTRRGAAPSASATLIVGAGRVGHLVAARLLSEPKLGLQPIGFLDKDPLSAGDPPLLVAERAELPVLGASYDLEDVIAEHGIRHVVIAFSTAPPNVVLDVVRRCWRLGVSVMVVPRLYEVEGRRTRVEHLGALPIVSLRPSDPRGWQFAVKYAVDRVIAAALLLALTPLLAVIAIGVKLSSPGPILFTQRRVGRDGQAFDMLKFRTMRGTPEQHGELDASWASVALGVPMLADSAGSDRRTPFGTFLRRTSLDELPQLWNVLRGDMSMVGPRPERTHYVERFDRAIYRYPDRHRVRSGVTGWAQVNGLRGETSLQDRIEWDNFYIENWSPLLDLKIVAMTVPALLFSRGHR
jgi:exopolysaccharide biosynthesis polyprenyl glycosylphosphotransferase